MTSPLSTSALSSFTVDVATAKPASFSSFSASMTLMLATFGTTMSGTLVSSGIIRKILAIPITISENKIAKATTTLVDLEDFLGGSSTGGSSGTFFAISSVFSFSSFLTSFFSGCFLLSFFVCLTGVSSFDLISSSCSGYLYVIFGSFRRSSSSAVNKSSCISFAS